VAEPPHTATGRRGHGTSLTRSVAFFFTGTFLETVVGPGLITGGFQTGDTATALRLAGALVVAAAAAVVLWCFVRFVRDGDGTPSPLAPPRRLVARGPYRFSRNPMYVASAAVIAGEGLLLGRPLLLLCAAVYLATMALLVLRFEEPLLRRRYGAEWDAYAARAPRWLA
jgi:protein-S-isoprenylcysteine O-methyltransferase Ste14